MIYDDYIRIHNEYVAKYGERCMLFMQVGDFFEVYAVQNEKERAGADIFTLGDLCNLQVTKKNKTIPDVTRSNPYMAGFPLHAMQKHVATLVNHDYTVVVVRQVTPPPNVKREVTEIYSPATYVQANGNTSGSASGSMGGKYLMVYYWDGMKRVGVSGVDLTTGSTWVYEVGATNTDPSFAIDEAYRLKHAYQPKEIVVIGAVDREVCDIFANEKCVHMVAGGASGASGAGGDAMKMYEKIAYQNEMLQKAFPTARGLLSPLEQLHMEYMDLGRIALVYMLQFAYEHNDHIIDKLHAPQILSKEKFLNLQYTSALQLNLISTQANERPLMHFLNRCATAFGSRAFKDRLMHPSQDPHVMEERYAAIEKLLVANTWQSIHKALSRVLDMERLARRIVLGSISPMEWNSIHESFEAMKEACRFAPGEDQDKIVTSISEIQHSYLSVLNLDECNKYTIADIQGNIFCEGVFPEIDEIDAQMKTDYARIEEIANIITGVGVGESTLCRIDCNERDGYYLCMTRKRYEGAMLSKPRIISPLNLQYRPLSSTSTMYKITNTEIDQMSQRLIVNKVKRQTLVTKRYKDFLANFDTEPFDPMIHYFANLDIHATCAKNACEYGYCRPTINHKNEKENEAVIGSCIHAHEIRHPIIERIHSHVDYVKNDVHLGRRGSDNERNGSDSAERGMLLYGINASGKSSYMKAIGLNLIMAQAGMYVAASQFMFTPFSHIFTRICNTDNIYRGLSSFTVEMTELCNILQRCDERSLVLGDELCAGTESVSALAIVSAGVRHLLSKNSCFVFATHLHELMDLAEFQKCIAPNTLGVYHMHIEMDPVTKKIIYERKIKPGRGLSIYGLEVCDALGMPKEFMELAHRVRREVQQMGQHMVRPKVSRYNTNTVMDVCKVCGKLATDTHHIRYQMNAGEDGFVEKGVHMNKESNLVPLCDECHDREHRGELHIEGYVQTSAGVEVKVAKKAVSKMVDIHELPTKWQGTLIYGIHGWKQKSATTQKWRVITEDTIMRKMQKIIGREITEDDMLYLRSTMV